jgi:hypothetical protein
MSIAPMCSQWPCCCPLIARRPPAAVNTFKDWLQQAVSCVTDTVITLSPDAYRPSVEPYRLTLGNGTPVPLAARGPTGQTRFGIAVLQAYRIVQESEGRRWKIRTAAYHYALRDADGREIFAYHWHPHVENVAYPHLHVSHGAVGRDVAPGLQLSTSQNVLQPQLAAAHLPTRRIALEDVLRLLIEQFGVQPARLDWDRALREARESFRADRIWL